MGRNIVLCFDGTNNKFGPTNTNVVKLYTLLDRHSQLCYYQTGVGTLLPPGWISDIKRWVIEKLDLAIAWLLSEHVCAGYRFLMRYYEPGDRVFMFGFSRGAYTARVLAGMLHRVGLLSRGNEELVPLAWHFYKKEINAALCGKFAATFSRPIRVHFLGLWDTVSSIGWAWDPRSLRFTAHNPSVDVVRHAVAVDERRAKFIQNLWAHDSPPDQDVKEVWFPGVHCDVGGGYDERDAGLSKISLKWMVAEADAQGLGIDNAKLVQVIPNQDTDTYCAPRADAPIHESLKCLWWLAEWIPLPWRVRKPGGYETDWHAHWGRPRTVPSYAVIDASVGQRKAAGVGYDPPNVP
jgi:uncharacterized protein (DUF2235 family)